MELIFEEGKRQLKTQSKMTSIEHIGCDEQQEEQGSKNGRKWERDMAGVEDLSGPEAVREPTTQLFGHGCLNISTVGLRKNVGEIYSLGKGLYE